MTRCLVIGGNGFLGSYVVDQLVTAGHEVTAFDRFSTGVRFSTTPARLVTGDFLNRGDLTESLKDQDVVYHLVSTTTPASAEADPLLDIRTNVTGSVELFGIAAAEGIKHLYFVSTGGAIYGEQPVAVVDETATPEPVSPYAIGKLAIERYLAYFRRVSGLKSTVLRLSNPYGPRQSPNRTQGVIPIFLRRIAAGKPITVFGDGSMSRDYIFVEDAARLITAPLGREGSHSTYNVGSGTSHTLDEIITTIEAVTNMKPTILRRPAPPTFVEHISLNTGRYRDDFGELSDPVGLEEGIRRTWLALQVEHRHQDG